MPLEKELAKFESMKEELLKSYLDKFALFREEEFVGCPSPKLYPRRKWRDSFSPQR